MAIHVTVRVSGNLDEQDLEVLRKWLEETYPAGWEPTSDPKAYGTLGTTEVLQAVLENEVLQAVLQNFAAGVGIGTVEVAARLLREKIRERFESIRDQYPDDDKPELDVQTVEQRDGESENGDTTGRQGGDAQAK
jgi:hypothetical protein